MSQNIITDFPITLYGNLEKYSDTISKGRCRIFYKYGNRNGTYITDEFAEKLLATIPYAPVKGIYELDEEDFTDHGQKRSEGRIYGLVPAEPNITWEPHLDDDGVERIYACVDVLIYTGLYAEANLIAGKGQSMELYAPSLKGEWKIINGKKYYVFSDGCFLGLQALGDSVEPCFEGAAFFSLCEDLKKIVAQIEKYNLNLHNGGKKMINYKLSDREKFNAIWSLLNVNYNEQGEWIVEYEICEIYENYAVVRNFGEGVFERVYYTKNDETDSIELGSRERCYIMDVSEQEKNALEALQRLNGNTYEKIDENYSSALVDATAKTEELETANGTINSLNDALSAANEALTAKTEEYNSAIEMHKEEISEFSTKISDLNESITTLTTERDDAISKLVEADASISSLNNQITILSSFKAEIEKKEKEAIVAKYAQKIDADIVATYYAKLDEYSDIKSLEKDLAYELVSGNQSVFSAETAPKVAYVPRDTGAGSSLEGILDKYKK